MKSLASQIFAYFSENDEKNVIDSECRACVDVAVMALFFC